MQFTNSALRAELGTCLQQLPNALARLAHHLQIEARSAWIWHPPDEVEDADRPPDLSAERSRELMSEAFQTIKYVEHQKPKASRIFPGLIAVSPDALPLADEVNRLKVRLARVLRAMENRTEIGVINQHTGEQGMRPLREIALEGFFFARLHHAQATRRVEVLRESADYVGIPEYVGFMWARVRNTRRTSRESLLTLGKSPVGRPLSDSDVALLDALPPGEPLAYMDPGRITPRANIRWKAHDGQAPAKGIRSAVLPLLMVGNDLPVSLKKLPRAPTPTHHRLARHDVELEPTPYLQAASIYRYIPQVREQKRKQLLLSRKSDDTSDEAD